MMRDLDRRIVRRLRLQYGRWALTHDALPFLRRHGWHRIIRPLRRNGYKVLWSMTWFSNTWMFRVATFLLAILVGLGLIAGGIYLIAWMPEFFTQATLPKNATSAESSEMLRRAWLRLAIVLISLILMLGLGMPSVDLRHLEESRRRHTGSVQHRSRLRMRRSSTFFWTAKRVTRSIVVAMSIVALVAVQLIWSASVSGGTFAAVTVTLLIGAISLGYLVRQTVIALQAVLVPARWSMPFSIGRAFLITASPFVLGIILLANRWPEADDLSWVGPFGSSAYWLHESARGRWIMLIPVVGMMLAGVLVAAGIGSLLKRYSFRRRIASARRHNGFSAGSLPHEHDGFTGDKGRISVDISPNHLRKEIRIQLNERNVCQHFFDWRSWLAPQWFRRRSAWYWVTIVPLLLLMLPIVVVQWMLADSTAPEVIGGAVRSYDQPTTVIERVIGSLVAFVILGCEVAALLDSGFSSPRRLCQRPVLLIGQWWYCQIDGIRRLPFQLGLALPVIALASFTIVQTDRETCLRFVVSAGVGLIVIRTIAVGFEQTLGNHRVLGNSGRAWYCWLHGSLFVVSVILLVIGMARFVSGGDAFVLVSAVAFTSVYLGILSSQI